MLIKVLQRCCFLYLVEELMVFWQNNEIKNNSFYIIKLLDQKTELKAN